jgi:hypothetical protein
MMQRQPTRATCLFGAIDVVRNARRLQVPATDWPENDPDLIAARALLGEERFAALRVEGRAMTLEQVTADAKACPEPG